jgi:hypothetical protein
MLLLLDPRSKTVPSNYSIQGFDFSVGEPPGSSLTEEAMEKAKRQESEYYDWKSYESSVSPNMEHPEYRSRSEESSLVAHWERILNELEPMPKGP